MKIRLVQHDVGSTDLTGHIEKAQADGMDMVCFHELATTGCLYERREVVPLEAVMASFAGYDIRILTGLPYLSQEGLRNACLYYHQGFSQLYHKINLFEPFNEHRVYMAGDETGIWQTDFGMTGVAICYDIRFESLFEEMKNAGVKTIFIPAAFPLVRVDTWRSLLIERAKQTGATVFGINAVGKDKQNEFGGNCMVVGPDGTVLGETGRSGEELIDYEL